LYVMLRFSCFRFAELVLSWERLIMGPQGREIRPPLMH
jgi:hypothetical protein